MFNSIKYFVLKFFLPPEKFLFEKIVDSGYRSISIYGAGEIGSALIPCLKKETPKIRIDMVADRAATYSSYELEGVEVVAPEKLLESKSEAVVVASVEFRDEMIEFLKVRGLSAEMNIISV